MTRIVMDLKAVRSCQNGGKQDSHSGVLDQ
jgi:hypothetical protein